MVYILLMIAQGHHFKKRANTHSPFEVRHPGHILKVDQPGRHFTLCSQSTLGSFEGRE